MHLFRTLVAAAVAVGLTASPAMASPRDSDRAFRAKKEGRSMPLPKIKQRVLPMIGADDIAVDLGPEFDGRTYRLKYIMKDGRVIWVDVDAATGRIKRSR